VSLGGIRQTQAITDYTLADQRSDFKVHTCEHSYEATNHGYTAPCSLDGRLLAYLAPHRLLSSCSSRRADLLRCVDEAHDSSGPRRRTRRAGNPELSGGG
jgi:hypothetical protein